MSIQGDSKLEENKHKAFVHSLLECLFGGHLEHAIDRQLLLHCMDTVMASSLSNPDDCVEFSTYVDQLVQCNSTESFRYVPLPSSSAASFYKQE